MTWRVVQKPAASLCVGIAYGWLIPNRSDLDAKICAALPGWAIVVNDIAQLSPKPSDIQEARKLTGIDSSAPVLLFAWSAGCQAVRSCLVSKIIDPWGVAVFDGTHANAPPADWQIQVWARLAERASAGLCAFVASATQMTYTKDIPAGHPGRAWPTSWVLARALSLSDGALEPGSPIEEQGLYVEVFPSKDIDKQAHEAQILDVAPRLLSRFASGPGRVAELVPDVPANVTDNEASWRDASITLAQRLIKWARAELQTWTDQGLKESDGPNDSPRIREYFGIPFRRRVTETILDIHGQAWCAAGACFGVSRCLLTSDPRGLTYRVSGLELEQDAKDNHSWGNDPGEGSLIIMFRAGASWYRHVGIVVSFDDDTVTFIAGNESDTWHGRTIKRSDPVISGYVKIG